MYLLMPNANIFSQLANEKKILHFEKNFRSSRLRLI